MQIRFYGQAVMKTFLGCVVAGGLFFGICCSIPSLLMAQVGSQQIPTNALLRPNQIRQIDHAIRTQIDQQQLVGVTIGVIQQGKIAYTQGYGWADQKNQVAMTPQTLIRWASISKTVAAVIAGQLVREGKLSFEADVRHWVPEFPDHGSTIRVRDLLCHQSGIVHYSNGPVIRTKRKYDAANPFQDVVLALDTFKDSPLIHRPGQRYSYSTHAYILLSAVTQRAEGIPFDQQIKNRICKPLGLTTLQPDYQWKEIANRSVGYRMVSDQIQESFNTDVSWKLAGGGMISSVEDMARYATALISSELLSDELKKQMWIRQKLSDGVETNVGLGFFVEGSDNTLKISHNGSQEKSKTRLVIYPQKKVGVVVMSNSEHAQPGQISTAIYSALRSQ